MISRDATSVKTAVERHTTTATTGQAVEPQSSGDASSASPRSVKCSGKCGEGNMTKQTKESGYVCDCEHGLPWAVATVWICQQCGDLHERVTNCACGKCVQFYENDRDGEIS
jgi:hypothetical protein